MAGPPAEAGSIRAAQYASVAPGSSCRGANSGRSAQHRSRFERWSGRKRQHLGDHIVPVGVHGSSPALSSRCVAVVGVLDCSSGRLAGKLSCKVCSTVACTANRLAFILPMQSMKSFMIKSLQPSRTYTEAFLSWSKAA